MARPSDAPRRGGVKAGLPACTAAPGSLEPAEVTPKNRAAASKRLIAAQGDRPLSSIAADDIRAALAMKTPAAGLTDLKAMRPAFRRLLAVGMIDADPTEGIKRPKLKKTDGYAPWNAADIEAFQARWPRGRGSG